jgi:hypothetical protein
MPLIPPPSGQTQYPYDNLESVLLTARVRLNDAIQTAAGDIITDSQPFTAQMCNDAWHKLQSFLANLGFNRLKNQFVALGMPPVGSTDPASQTWWNWIQFFDGESYFIPPVVTVLPADFILPLRIWERQAGTSGFFAPMHLAADGLPDQRKMAWNVWFEWRQDAIYMPGSLHSMDYRVEYAAFLADFPVDSNGLLVTPSTQLVPIMRCRSAFANYICAEAAWARADTDAQAFVQAAEDDCTKIYNTEVKLKQRTPVSRRPFSGRGVRSRLWGYQGY